MRSESAGQRLLEEMREQERTSVIRDQWLIPAIYKLLHGKDVQPIVSEGFIYKSQERYNAAWLARELIQNFIDANPGDKQTLNGVHFEEEDIPAGEELPNGGKRFKITGDWKFAKPTGLLSPHSEKADDRETAGGNGIGLKQAALRLFRDFGIKRFDVTGERWNVAYGLTDKEELNGELHAAADEQGAEPAGTVDHNWLVGELSRSGNSGTNTYLIETDNPEVIAVLQEAQKLGVSKENPYLQEPDFENEHGAIKWLPPRTAEGGRREHEQSALFLNGQMMNVRTEGDKSTDYWRGPEYMTLRLNDVKYDMSIDRPPVTIGRLGMYASDFVRSMGRDDVIVQLKKSEAIWTQVQDIRYSSDRPACFAVIEQLVQQLRYDYSHKPEDVFEEHFSGKPYLALDRGVGESEQEKLRKQGYILCPEYFSQIGMPLASTKMERRDKLAGETPDEAVYDRKRFAMTKGMDVYGDAIPEELKDAQAILDHMLEKCKATKPHVELLQNPLNTVRVTFPVQVPESLLFHPLPRPQSGHTTQELLYLVRGVIAHGLERGIFAEAHTIQPGYFSNYKLRRDDVTQENILMVRHVEQARGAKTGDFCFECTLSPDEFAALQSGKSRKVAKREAAFEAAQSAASAAPDVEESLREPRLPQPKKRSRFGIGTVAAGLLATVTALWAANRDEAPSVPPERTPAGATSGKILNPENLGGGARHAVETSAAKMQQRLENLATMPGLDTALDQLRDLARKNNMKEPARTALGEYEMWKSSKDYYGSLVRNKTGYLGSTTLMEILAKNEEGINIAAAPERGSSPHGQLAQELTDIANRLSPEDEHVGDDFEIVMEPSQNDLAQLAMLRTYLELCTDLQSGNDLFLYRATGSTGINLGKRAIGIHIEMLRQPFFKAMTTYVHESAHSNPEATKHGDTFQKTEEALFAAMSERLDDIAERAANGTRLTPREKVLLDLENQWEKLRQMH